VDGEDLNPLQIIMKATVENKRPQVPPECPVRLRSLITRCWDKDPKVRPPFDIIIKELEAMEASREEMVQALEDAEEEFLEPTLTYLLYML
jgi:hypothetical protein